MAADALTPYPPVGAGAGTGNRCGHERAAPDLDPRWTPGHNRHQIRVLDRADRKIEALYGRAHGRVHRAWRPVHAARQARGIRRLSPRSERREACIRLMRYMVRRVDLRRWEIGVPNVHGDDGFYRFGWAEIAEALGMSVGRVQRAASDLQQAGWIHVQRRGRGLTAAKKITMSLMRALGLADWIAGARNKRKHRVSSAVDRAEAAAGKMALKAALAGAQRAPAENPAESPAAPQPPPEAANARSWRDIKKLLS